MRPGQVCPGKKEPDQISPPVGGASMRPGQVCPGKNLHAPGVSARFHRFNEARASLPGKGHLHRFNEARASLPDLGTAVASPRFNEARASLPGKATPSEVLARCRFPRGMATTGTDRPFGRRCGHSFTCVVNQPSPCGSREKNGLRPLAEFFDLPQLSRWDRQLTDQIIVACRSGAS